VSAATVGFGCLLPRLSRSTVAANSPDVRFNVVGDHSPEDFYGFVCRGHDSSGYWPEDVAPPEGDFVPRRDAEKGLLDPLVDRSKL